MTAPQHLPARRGFRIALLAVTLASIPLLPGLPSSPASAAGSITVDSPLGSGQAAADGATTITVAGSGLQSIPKAFGGVYVVFGYAPDTGFWAPSQGGKSGTDFFYVADSQAKDNGGYQRFVAFPGSSTSDSANGGTLSAEGSFSLSMVIPGPTFSHETASGGSTVDCREVQCGIFTFGAHGVVNANNETFTPLSFGAAAVTSTETNTNKPVDEAATTPAAGAGEPEAPAAPSTAAPKVVTNGAPSLGVTAKTVVAGNVLSFTGQGFAAGEQVAAALSGGVSAAGPIVAGSFGEVAGAVEIPMDMVAGTHKLTLIGAASKTNVAAEFAVMANPAGLASPTQDEPAGIWWALTAVIAAACVLLLVVLTSLFTALTRRRNSARQERSSAPAASPRLPAAEQVGDLA
ncbi:hypothetical protein ART_2667 [Arthrobacter sp. PAMC 25486]|uniref:hypothetical protein n=1 Tax=Arthrobacter sp. PAMC 25486 TaxID=1494608 RepID=UPI000535AB58|nr:hypothetical protein [Arthrobacter sp. PAMC 25486]AIY02266.1 hypothetical protein ART_2667 [Arthrobacter sp. PAMC 25486]